VHLAVVFANAGDVVMALAVCGAFYACGATWAMGRFVRRPPAGAPASTPSVTVLRPLHGDEPQLYENLASLCRQTYGGPIQLILGVQDPADAALTIAERARRDFPDRDIVVTVDAAVHGSNRKIGNLINMSSHAVGDIIVISDSDVRLPADGVAQIVAALQAPGVGLVHCLYRGRPTASGWSKLAAMDIDTRFAASVVVGEALGAHPCLGPTMALRADLLRQIGGLPILADQLADDFVLGQAVRTAGHTIGWPPMIIDHVFPERSLRELFTHELRWARTIRLVQPAGYLGSVVMHFLPLALIGAALTGFAGWAMGLLIALILFRLAQAHVLNRLIASEQSLLWLIPVRDLLSFGVFIAAFLGDRIEWRGNRLKVERDGAMAASR
jgi:ceramide glucosyltransferase